MLSKLEICNKALTHLGRPPLMSLSGSTVGQTLDTHFDSTRDAALRGHPWNFAISRKALVASSEEPIFDWAHQFVLPNDCLRVLGTNLDKRGYSWKVEGQYLMIDSDEVSIKYIRRVEETGYYDPSFIEAFALLLASNVAAVITGNIEDATRLFETYRMKLGHAKTMDGQESMGDALEAEDWLNSRI